MNSGAGSATADNVMSMKKVAKVTIGGDVSVRMYHHNTTVKEMLPNANADRLEMTKTKDLRTQDFRVNDANIYVKAEVGDWFEAVIRADLHDNDKPEKNSVENAHKAYLHWKNICNSGFGVLVGRNDIVFGSGETISDRTGFMGGSGNSGIEHAGGMNSGSEYVVAFIPQHLGYDFSRTTQITPYWQNQSGTFKAELSYMQDFEVKNTRKYTDPNATYPTRYRSYNGGFGSGSVRLTWKPIDGLKIVGSVINLHNSRADWDNAFVTEVYGKEYVKKNNTATNITIAYVPCFLPALKLHATWQHEWNAGYIKDNNNDVFQFGAQYGFTPKLTVWAYGEYFKTKAYKFRDLAGEKCKQKQNAWALDIGARYNFGNGLSTRIGYRHEDAKAKLNGKTYAKAKDDMIYARLDFNF